MVWSALLLGIQQLQMYWSQVRCLPLQMTQEYPPSLFSCKCRKCKMHMQRQNHLTSDRRLNYLSFAFSCFASKAWSSIISEKFIIIMPICCTVFRAVIKQLHFLVFKTKKGTSSHGYFRYQLLSFGLLGGVPLFWLYTRFAFPELESKYCFPHL